MQIRHSKRMDVDENANSIFNPVKPTGNRQNIGLKGKGNNGARQQRRKNRTFGQDITNQSNYINHEMAGNGKEKMSIDDNDDFKVNKKKKLYHVEPVKVEIITRSKSDISLMNNTKHRTNDRRSKSISNLEREITEIIECGEESENEEGEETDFDEEDLDLIECGSMHPWDLNDINCDLAVTDYVNEIMQSLRNDELSGYVIQSNEDFMSMQNDVNARMRVVLVDWLIEVHRKFKLLPTTYFLAINLLDRYLQKTQVERKTLQLTGCTCLWIASKYHEIYAPEMDDFVYISDNAFADHDLIRKEIEILKVLDFNLTVPTVLSFTERYNKILTYYLKKERERKLISDLMMYIIEHCVVSYEICREYPSKIAAAAFLYSCISTKVFTVETFKNDNLNEVIGYDIDELCDIMKNIDHLGRNAKKSKHKAVYKKYSHQKYSNIAKLNFSKLNTSFIISTES